MLLQILEYLNFSVLLIFGVFVSAFISGTQINKKNIYHLSLLSIFLLLLQYLSNLLIGFEITVKIYPFISHLPLVLFLVFHFHHKLSSSVLSVSIAYLCCQISKWCCLLVLYITNNNYYIYYISRIIFNIIIGLILIYYFSNLLSTIISKPDKTVLIFGILPIVYYLFDYASTVYSDWLYQGNVLVFEFLPFSLAIFYLIFCVVYFKEYEQKNEEKRQKQIIQIQATQSIKEIEAIRKSIYEMSILRHDMRHHLQTIYSFIENGNESLALQYIKETLSSVDSTAIKKFCTNELVNSVLSYYNSLMSNKHIIFENNISLENDLPCSELEFCSILSNGLENAIKAVTELDVNERKISLILRIDNNKLLLSIQNPYINEPTFIDDMPVSKQEGHGLGTQSIRYTVNKLNGNCQFKAKNGIFTLRVII